MIRMSYTLKCWALSITYYVVFYFGIFPSDPTFSKYIYPLAISTLSFPIAKHVVDIVSDALAPNVIIFNGLLLSLLINIVIWILTPIITILTLVVFLFHSLIVLKNNVMG